VSLQDVVYSELLFVVFIQEGDVVLASCVLQVERVLCHAHDFLASLIAISANLIAQAKKVASTAVAAMA
tara:strand:- start:103 stop:309 length:207 start_codon:yes stop_codon:yes gene_type:complete